MDLTAFMVGSQPGAVCEEEIRERDMQPPLPGHMQIIQNGLRVMLVYINSHDITEVYYHYPSFFYIFHLFTCSIYFAIRQPNRVHFGMI